MPVTSYVRASVRALGSYARKLVLLSCVTFILSHTATAVEPSKTSAYHATLFNGAIVGSAFMIADGVVVTNAHVVTGRRPGDVVTLSTQGHRQERARVVAISSRMDLAVLSVAKDLMPVVPGSNASHARGVSVYAVGIAADGGDPRKRYVIKGRVSSKKRDLAPFGSGVIAQMPQIRKGFSGGPVFNDRGQLVGMVAALRTSSNTRGREAFILSVEDIRAEVRRLVR